MLFMAKNLENQINLFASLISMQVFNISNLADCKLQIDSKIAIYCILVKSYNHSFQYVLKILFKFLLRKLSCN